MLGAPPAHSLLLFRRHVTLVRPGRLAWEDRTWMLPSDTPRANRLDCNSKLGFSVRLPLKGQPIESWRPAQAQGAQMTCTRPCGRSSPDLQVNSPAVRLCSPWQHQRLRAPLHRVQGVLPQGADAAIAFRTSCWCCTAGLSVEQVAAIKSTEHHVCCQGGLIILALGSADASWLGIACNPAASAGRSSGQAAPHSCAGGC